jgi:glycosyltransferase involved in cell wall biosynthesis
MWTHGYYGKETRLEKILKLILYGLSNHVFLYGNYAKHLMLKENIAPERKLSVIYNSLDYNSQILEREALFPESLYQEHFKNDNPNLIFVGRLTSKKKLDMILNGLNILSNKGLQYNLTLIGEGEAQNNLKVLADKLDLNQNIWFYGPSFNESVLAKMIYNADLCVSPGNVGLTAIHSMMFGTPVITHNNFKFQMPEFEAIEPLVTGAFFEYGDVHSLTETITSWFEKAPDRNEIRQRCYKVIDEKYNPHVQIETMKSALNRHQ